MGAGGVGHSVGGHHDEGGAHRQFDELRFHHVHDDGAAFFAEHLEGLFGDADAGVLHLDVAVGHAQLLLPAFVEDGGGDAGGGGGVGVCLGGHIHSGGARAGDQVERDREVVEARTVQVDDVERGAGGERVREDFLDRGDRHVAHMGIDGDLDFRGELEDAVDLGVVRARVVLVGHSDTEAAGAELVGDLLVDDGVAVRRDGGVVAFPQEVRVLDDEFGAGALGFEDGRDFFGDFRDAEQSHAAVGDRGAVVEDRLAGAAFEESGDPGDAAFEFEGGGDAVHRLVTVRLDGLAVGVEVYEARGDDLAGGVEQGPALAEAVRQDLAADGGDLVAGDADVAHRVEAGLRVEDAAAGDDQVQVAFLDGRGGEGRRRGEDSGGQGQEGEGGEPPDSRAASVSEHAGVVTHSGLLPPCISGGPGQSGPKRSGAPWAIRTPDLQVRSLLLCPLS